MVASYLGLHRGERSARLGQPRRLLFEFLLAFLQLRVFPLKLGALHSQSVGFILQVFSVVEQAALAFAKRMCSGFLLFAMLNGSNSLRLQLLAQRGEFAGVLIELLASFLVGLPLAGDVLLQLGKIRELGLATGPLLGEFSLDLNEPFALRLGALLLFLQFSRFATESLLSRAQGGHRVARTLSEPTRIDLRGLRFGWLLTGHYNIPSTDCEPRPPVAWAALNTSTLLTRAACTNQRRHRHETDDATCRRNLAYDTGSGPGAQHGYRWVCDSGGVR